MYKKKRNKIRYILKLLLIDNLFIMKNLPISDSFKLEMELFNMLFQK